MASPQKENGHTQIANELYEAILIAPLTIREMKIVLTVIRYTYGFNRKEHELSVRFISNATGIKFQHIADSIKTLKAKNVITISESNKHKQGRIIKLNKDYETWVFNSSRKGDSSQKSDGSVPKRVTVRVPKRVTKKYNKEKLNTYTVEDFEKFWSIFPNGELGNKGSKKKAKEEFLKLKPNDVNLDALITAVNRQAEYKRIKKSKNEFVPQFQNVERWLKNERWTDEIPEQKQTLELKPYNE